MRHELCTFQSDRRPFASKLAGYRSEHDPGEARCPMRRDRRERDRVGDREAALATTRRSLDVLEHRPGGQWNKSHLDTGVAENVELFGASCLAIDAHQGVNVEPEAGESE
jgi:hypothetical protein